MRAAFPSRAMKAQLHKATKAKRLINDPVRLRFFAAIWSEFIVIRGYAAAAGFFRSVAAARNTRPIASRLIVPASGTLVAFA